MKTGNDAMFLTRAISSFVNAYAPEHLTESGHTLKSYISTLNKYLAFLEDRKEYTTQTLEKKCFERTMIEEWLRYMRTEEKLSPESCNVRLGGLRTFLKYLGTRDINYKYLYLEAMDIPLRKTGKKKVSGLTKSAVKAVMAEPDQFTKTGKRDLLFMMIAYGTAARISEILAIRLDHIILTVRSRISLSSVKGTKPEHCIYFRNLRRI